MVLPTLEGKYTKTQLGESLSWKNRKLSVSDDNYNRALTIEYNNELHTVETYGCWVHERTYEPNGVIISLSVNRPHAWVKVYDKNTHELLYFERLDSNKATGRWN